MQTCIVTCVVKVKKGDRLYSTGVGYDWKSGKKCGDLGRSDKEAWWRHNTTCMESNVQNDSGRSFIWSCARNGLTIMSKHILRPHFLCLMTPAEWRRQSSAIWIVPVTWTTSVDRPTNCDCLMHAVSQVCTYVNSWHINNLLCTMLVHVVRARNVVSRTGNRKQKYS